MAFLSQDLPPHIVGYDSERLFSYDFRFSIDHSLRVLREHISLNIRLRIFSQDLESPLLPR